MIRGHVVVFAKAPAMGRVKTRLAREVGALTALRFHRHSTERLLRVIAADRRWRLWLAIAPDRAAAGPRFWRIAAPRLPQGLGDLGRRMRRPIERLPPGPVVIVGSDIPSIERRHVAAAFAALGRHDFVLGPASDGGYWLVGTRRRRVAPGLFRNVRWSTAHALADTLAGMAGRSVALLEVLDDVDDAASLRRAQESSRRTTSR
jgi:rSAM/selenodomain-associated transferase 1